MQDPLWRPSADRVAGSNLTAFLKLCGQPDYASLHRWSVDRREEFWAKVWDFCGVKASRRYDEMLANDRMPGAHWFTGARLNFAENLLRFDDDRPALISWTEHGRDRQLTHRQLRDRVASIGARLRQWGIRPGDRVAGYLPNVPDTVVAMLAAASVGATWSSCSPDFGVQAVVDRFGQIAPRVLFAAAEYTYNGKLFDCSERTRQIAAQVPSIERVETIPFDVPGPAPALEFEQLPFDHPVYILYSSGTTGKPKCIVHGAGGTLIQHLKEHVLHVDLKPADRIFYYTTCGWMMWNWLASALAVGSTVVLYDGNPMSPHAARLWDMAAGEGISIFGTSAKYLAMAEKGGVRPRETHRLNELRTILSTGSPLAPESYDYVYRDIKPDVLLASISGGTDLVGCFAQANPHGAVYRGELQAPALGMKVEVWDSTGKPLVEGTGELVCTRAFPSMPVGFWNDPSGETYRATYFAHFPGVWRHGDWAEFTPSGGMRILGRSDAVLNPGGVRIGTAEIYNLVEQLPEVLESIVIAQDWEGDVRPVLFVRLRPGHVLDDVLRDRIRRHLRENASPRHVPARVVEVTDIPRTISGKISELAVRDVVHGRPVKNAEALANPESLDQYRDRPELRE